MPHTNAMGPHPSFLLSAFRISALPFRGSRRAALLLAAWMTITTHAGFSVAAVATASLRAVKKNAVAINATNILTVSPGDQIGSFRIFPGTPWIFPGTPYSILAMGS